MPHLLRNIFLKNFALFLWDTFSTTCITLGLFVEDLYTSLPFILLIILALTLYYFVPLILLIVASIIILFIGLLIYIYHSSPQTRANKHSINSIDEPVDTFENDRLGFTQFACDFLYLLTQTNEHLIGLPAPWGSGKTSFINIMQSILKELQKPNTSITQEYHFYEDPKDWNIRIIYFSCLEISSSESLIATIFRFIAPHFTSSSSSAALSFAEVIESLTSFRATTFLSHYYNRLFQIRKEELIADLKRSKTRYIIAIDDVDRISPEETKHLISELQSIYNLNNLIYLIPYDNDRLSQAIGLSVNLSSLDECQRYGNHFLEKFIAYRHPLPPIHLEQYIRKGIEELCVRAEDAEEINSSEMQKFLPYLFTHIKTIRDVKHFFGAIFCDTSNFLNELFITDLLIISFLRQFIPNLYDYIKNHQAEFLTSNGLNVPLDKQLLDNHWEETARAERKKRLMPLIPDSIALDETQFDKLLDLLFSEFNNPDQTYARKRLCHPKYFGNYFFLSPSTDVITAQERKAILQDLEKLSTCRGRLVNALERNNEDFSAFFTGGMNSELFPVSIALNALTVFASLPESAETIESYGWAFACLNRLPHFASTQKDMNRAAAKHLCNLFDTGTSYYFLRLLLHYLSGIAIVGFSDTEHQVCAKTYLRRFADDFPLKLDKDTFCAILSNGMLKSLALLQSLRKDTSVDGLPVFTNLCQQLLQEGSRNLYGTTVCLFCFSQTGTDGQNIVSEVDLSRCPPPLKELLQTVKQEASSYLSQAKAAFQKHRDFINLWEAFAGENN